MDSLLAPKYEKYIDSGEGWIGEIPDHWVVLRLKSLFCEKKYISNMALSCGAISFGEVVQKSDEMITDSTKHSYQEVLSGEFLINPLNLNYDLTSLRIALSKIDVVVSSGYIVLKEVAHINKQYFKYLLHRYDVAVMKLLGAGVRQTISFNQISNSLLIYPPLEEQLSISKFLDQKCTQIDQAVKFKKRQIERFKERKQILIQQAVTRGLNPDASMRDSGIEWIGEIPAHWDLQKVKHLSSFITSGPRGWSDFFSENGAYFLQSGNLNEDMAVEWGSAVRVNPRLGAEGLRTRLRNNDVVVCITGAKTGKAAIAEFFDGREVYINQHLALIRPVEAVVPRYLALTLHSAVGQTYFFLEQYGLKQGLGLDDVKNALVILPPRGEQEKIVAHVDAQSALIARGIELLQQQITKLKEYKATLINSAVTGKIKVPGVVEPAEIEEREIA
ncbi:restriction endonuclease subunit S [Pseudomonas baltica]|uniref:Restriction endonuclease subunit S n=1 Tax=Pseudomonas baltica TaxID=2762576 RepID=A0A7X1G6Z4_9PSED|nr:restriction endonuclease subunit S [Pseudomonas baltica]MBC2679623.1 restriction endonuclease subunit S [Pseudomonas baltica]